jgi:hypothetical protein
VVSVLATGSKGRGFQPGQGDGFLRAIKSEAHLSSDGKYGQRPHVVRFYGMLKIFCSLIGTDRVDSHFLRPFSYLLQRCLC